MTLLWQWCVKLHIFSTSLDCDLTSKTTQHFDNYWYMLHTHNMNSQHYNCWKPCLNSSYIVRVDVFRIKNCWKTHIYLIVLIQNKLFKQINDLHFSFPVVVTPELSLIMGNRLGACSRSHLTTVHILIQYSASSHTKPKRNIRLNISLSFLISFICWKMELWIYHYTCFSNLV
jgi:hypothetical protein